VGIALPDSENDVARALSELSFDAGIVATVVSGAGILPECIGMAVGGALGNVPGAAVGGAVGYGPFNTAESLIGGISTGLTIAADVVAGNTYLSLSGQTLEVAIGQDTIVSVGGFALGAAVPEAVVDTGINAGGVIYSGLRMNGTLPNGQLVLTISWPAPSGEWGPPY